MSTRPKQPKSPAGTATRRKTSRKAPRPPQPAPSRQKVIEWWRFMLGAVEAMHQCAAAVQEEWDDDDSPLHAYLCGRTVGELRCSLMDASCDLAGVLRPLGFAALLDIPDPLAGM